MKETLLEDRCAAYVLSLGGAIRKVQWIGRKGAPDRLVLLPGGWFWVEFKRPGLAASFPATPHERQQAREHEILRRYNHPVVVVDDESTFRHLVDLLKKRKANAVTPPSPKNP